MHRPPFSMTTIAAAPLALLGCAALGQAPSSHPTPSPSLASWPGQPGVADSPSPSALGVAPAGEPAPVRFAAALGHSLYARSNPPHLSLKIDVAGAVQATPSRPPLNLAIVIDRSGSMAEDKKFEHALRAAALVFENLSERDVISLVAFDEKAVVLSPAGPAANRDFLDHRLGDISPVGWTNLSAGVLEGFAQIDSRAADGQTKRVVVLTDGMANRGVTSPDELKRLLTAAKGRGISVSTIGVGTQFDEALLKAMAEAGGGRYAYAATAEDIPRSVSAEVEGLLRVVAQNASVRVRVEGGKITFVHGRSLESPVAEYTLKLGDVREGERAVFLMEIEPGAFSSGAEVSVQAEMTLDDVERARRASAAASAKAAFSGDAAAVRAGVNQSVTLYCGVLDALEKAEDAVLGLDDRRYREAATMFTRRHDEARAFALSSRDQDLLNQTFLLKHLMTDLESARAAGMLHGHDAAEKALPKAVDYQRYLREHHR